MNANSQTRPAASGFPASRLARAYGWFRRARDNARARHALAEVDTRTLRDIGVTRRDITVFKVADCAR
jgi:uncharacterized protein YjiS (DUF1127 family)